MLNVRHPLVVLLTAALMGSVAATANGAVLAPWATPRTLASDGAPASCPRAENIDGRAAAAVTRDFITGERRLPGDELDDADSITFMGWMMLAGFVITPSPVVTVCDPSLAAAGQPIGGIGGDARDAPATEAIAAGLRSRLAPSFGAASGAAIGDRFTLPAVTAAAQIDLSVDTAGGVSSVRLGPFASAPTTLRISGTSAAPTAVFDLADGTSTTQPITAASAITPKVSPTMRNGRLVLRVTGAPDAFLFAQTPEPKGGETRFLGIDERGDVQAATSAGSATLKIGPLSLGDRLVELSIIDPARRVGQEWRCQLTWKARAVRRVACAGAAPGTVSRSSRSMALPSQGWRMPAEHPAPSTSWTPVTAGSARGHRAAAPALAPIAATVIHRAAADTGFIEDAEVDGEALFADVTGDGRPDLAVGDGALDPLQLLASTPAGGWKAIGLKNRMDFVSTGSSFDVTGDGIDELLLSDSDDSTRLVAGSKLWTSAPPSAIDARVAALAPFDLGLASIVPTALTPFGDATGDGRPELGVIDTQDPARWTVATYASEAVPLGRPAPLPAFLALDPAALWSLGDGRSAATVVDSGRIGLTVRGGLLVGQVVAAADGKRGAATFAAVGGDGASFVPLPAPPLPIAGQLSIEDFDPLTGDFLVATNAEACRRRDCVGRIGRLNADGVVVASLAVRGATAKLTARFVDDGPDADARADVVLRAADSQPGKGVAAPGFDGTIALWNSATGSPAFKELPVLALGGSALKTRSESLRSWTSPDGRHHVGTWVVRGTGRSVKIQFVTLGAPR